VRVRSSNDQTTWSLWENAANGAPLAAVPPGKYLQVETTLQITSGDVSPVLYDLTVAPATTVNLGQLVYQSAFQNNAGSEWSVSNIAKTPVGGRSFLGPFANTNATLTLTDLPSHSVVTVAYDLFILGPWDGNNTNDGPDLFTTDVAGGLKLLNATFNNTPENSVTNGQSFPQPYGALNPARTGAAETNTLGYSLDTVYRLSHTFPHTASPLVLNFGASGLNTNETWGIGAMRVYITPLGTPSKLVPLGFQLDGFHLLLQGAAQQVYQLQTTTNLVDWSSLGVLQLQSTSLEAIDSAATNSPRRFYRALQAP